MFLSRAPNLVYFVQGINTPGTRIGVVNQYTPQDTLPWPGDALYREDLVVRFKVDEDARNYMEIWDWMTGLAAPDSPAQYRALSQGKNQRASDVFSDVTVTVTNNVHRVNLELRFQDAFPVALSGMEYATTEDGATFMDVTVAFKFRHFTVHRGADVETPTASAPVSIERPEIEMTTDIDAQVYEGQTVFATTGIWTGFPAPSLAYQWYRGASPIDQASTQTYVLQAADVGQQVTVRVTATNASGTATAASSPIVPAAL
jgi:hypothetical protein